MGCSFWLPSVHLDSAEVKSTLWVLCLSTCQAVETRFSMMTEIKIKSTNMLGTRHALHIASWNLKARLYVVTISKKEV